MKRRVRPVNLVLAFGSLAALGLAGFIRLAPVDPARWHRPLAQDAPATAGCAVIPARASASAACLFADPPQAVLARLDAAARATPRTSRIAGSPAEGRITWQTRSAVWGFPDYTTAQASLTPQGSRLDLYARLRFGGNDFGVNAARLKHWLARL